MARPIDANVAMKKIREYMKDFPNAHTRLATCRAILSMLGDENQIPTLTQPNERLTLDELRNIGNAPVWIVWGDNIQEWALVRPYDDITVEVLRFDGYPDYFRIDEYGEYWTTYRCPPEGEEDT